MKHTIKILFVLIATVGCFAITVNAQVQKFTCFQKNYGEGAGWQKADFVVKIDMDNFKISIYDPKLNTFIRFSSTIHTINNGRTNIFEGTDQSGVKCNVFIELTDPPMLTVQYFNKFYQYYKLK